MFVVASTTQPVQPSALLAVCVARCPAGLQVQITESRDYGIYHMAFFGTPRGDIGASRTPISVWMWIKCFKSQPTPENPLSTMQLQGTFIHFYTADPNWIMTDHPMISAEHGEMGLLGPASRRQPTCAGRAGLEACVRLGGRHCSMWAPCDNVWHTRVAMQGTRMAAV